MTDEQDGRGQFAKRVARHDEEIAELREGLRKLRVACCEFAEALDRECSLAPGQVVQITKALGGPFRGPRH